MFAVVPSTCRKYGYSINAPADVKWATGPGNTFGWYRRKSDAQKRANELSRGFSRFDLCAPAGRRSGDGE